MPLVSQIFWQTRRLYKLVRTRSGRGNTHTHLEYVYYWLSHVELQTWGFYLEYFVFLPFLSVTSHLSPLHPLLVERQWAVTDGIRNEQHCHSPASPLAFILMSCMFPRLCSHLQTLLQSWAAVLSQENAAAPALALQLQPEVCLGRVCLVIQEGLLLLLCR